MVQNRASSGRLEKGSFAGRFQEQMKYVDFVIRLSEICSRNIMLMNACDSRSIIRMMVDIILCHIEIMRYYF